MLTILKRIKGKLTGSNVIAPQPDFRMDALKNILDNGLGHKKSFELQKPVDNGGNPLPWFTYPAIEYIKQLDLRKLAILEWGIGNSSLFFAARCNEIVSVEHNKEWFDLISGSMPSNAHAIFATEDEYDVIPLQQNRKFDIIIVDGIKRADCINVAIKLMEENGIIIFDNSDRNPDLCEILRNQNLLQIDFHGFGPINPYAWTTSLFFSRSNTLKPLSVQPLIPAGGGY